MQLPKQKDGEDMRPSRSHKHRSSNLPLLDLRLLFHQRDRVVVNGVGNFMAKRAGELFRVLYEIEERIHYIHVPARGCECVRLSLMDEVELKRMVVSGLRNPSDCIRNRLQLVV